MVSMSPRFLNADPMISIEETSTRSDNSDTVRNSFTRTIFASRSSSWATLLLRSLTLLLGRRRTLAAALFPSALELRHPSRGCSPGRRSDPRVGASCPSSAVGSAGHWGCTPRPGRGPVRPFQRKPPAWDGGITRASPSGAACRAGSGRFRRPCFGSGFKRCGHGRLGFRLRFRLHVDGSLLRIGGHTSIDIGFWSSLVVYVRGHPLGLQRLGDLLLGVGGARHHLDLFGRLDLFGGVDVFGRVGYFSGFRLGLRG